MQSLGVDRLFDSAPLPAQTAAAGAVTSLAIAVDASGNGARYLVSVEANGALRRRLLTRGSIGQVAHLDFPYGTPAALAAGPGGTLYLATEPPIGEPGSSLFVLTPVVNSVINAVVN
jgi:hypothetical protein